MLDIVSETHDKIKSMEIRGALNIAIAAAESLAVVAAEASGNNQAVQTAINEAGEKLRLARPTAVSLPNTIDYVQYLAKQNLDQDERPYRGQLIKSIASFISEQKSTLPQISEIGARLIEDGDTVLTHCNSQTAIDIIIKAHQNGTQLKAFCTETRPRHQGYLTAGQLKEAGVDVTLTIDSAVNLSLKEHEIDKVFVGADAVLVTGDLINKIGTSQVSLAAKAQGVDFYVGAESIKFSPQSVAGQVIPIEERDRAEVTDQLPPEINIYNPSFDVTDHRNITAIITEVGVIPPQAAYTILKEKYGWELK